MKNLLAVLLLSLISLPTWAMTQSELEAAALKEGEVHLFSNGLDYGFVLERAFRKKYPAIKIHHDVFEAVAGRFYFHNLMESGVDAQRADVVLRCQDRDLPEWVDSDWLADLTDLPNWSKRPVRLEDDKRYVYFLGSPHVVFYNPAVTKESDLPKDYDEVLQPKWKGHVAMRSPLRGNSGAFFTHFIKSTRGDLSWYSKMGANKPFVGQMSYSVHDAVESGKYRIGLSRDVEVLAFARDYKKKTGKTSKLKYRIMENESPYQYQLSLVNRKAPHSAAAKLFVNFVLSDEGMKALEDAGYSVGQRQIAQLDHQKLWQWKLSDIKRFWTYVSTLAEAFRDLETGGAKIEAEGKTKDVAAAD